MSRSAIDVLEFDKLRAILRRFTTSAPGRRAVDALAPSSDRFSLDSDFALIREAIAWLRAGGEMGFGSLADPDAWLARMEIPGAVLAPQDLLDAASLLDTAAWLRTAFHEEAAVYPLLDARTRSLADFRPLAAAIRRAILPNGEISDDASPQLKKIRHAIARARDGVQKHLKAILRARGAEAGDDYVTLRNDRFVIPVRAADRKAVPGVVHGSSATGQTIFVEPFDTVELNNQLVQLADDEAAEIHRILAELTEKLQSERGPLRFAADTIALLDSVFARGRFAREFNCCLPAFSEGNALRLDAARHPTLEDKLRAENRAIVPMSLALGGDETVLVISGPNTGGKTVALKTVGLAALSAQSGIPVAAESATLPLFDRVLVDIGDEQSIAADLSTFSAHMLNLRGMLAAATPQSLVLADEMGTGTAPEEGSALAVALLEEFRAKKSLTLATTHHDRLKSYASTSPGVVNAAVEFDTVNLRPTYRLLVGVPGVSSGIDIAQRLELPARIIDRARAQLAPETREAADLIAYLHRSRDELDDIKRQAREQIDALAVERAQLRTEWAERQRRRIAELEQRFGEVLTNYEREIKKLVGDVKDRQLRAQLEKQTGKKIVQARTGAREETDAAVVQTLSESQQDLGISPAEARQPVAPDLLVAGAKLQVRGFKQPVILRQLDGNSADVQAGPLRMKIRLDDITAVLGETSSPAPVAAGLSPAKSAVTVNRDPASALDAAARAAAQLREKQSAARRGDRQVARSGDRRPATDEPAIDELNVIGRTVEQASELVDKFLDTAVLDGKLRIRIIHGYGTGALRRGLREFLSDHPHVERFADAEPDHGGAAVTTVVLKT
jgi:DNA mismatch repair protein MutS2